MNSNEHFDPDDEDFDYEPDLRLSITWLIDENWQLTQDRSKAAFLICEDEEEGDWYEIDARLGIYEGITVH
jgi:hypothetical protein